MASFASVRRHASRLDHNKQKNQEESRSQVPDPQSPIPDPEFQILNSNSQVPGS